MLSHEELLTDVEYITRSPVKVSRMTISGAATPRHLSQTRTLGTVLDNVSVPDSLSYTTTNTAAAPLLPTSHLTVQPKF